MNTEPELPIVLPENWTEQDDRDFYLNDFGSVQVGEAEEPEKKTARELCIQVVGEKEDYCRQIMAFIAENHRNMNTVLDSMLEYLLDKASTRRLELIGALALPEKIQWLQALLCAHSSAPDYLRRLTTALAACLAVDHERQRVLAMYRAPQQPLWIYPLCRLSDCLVGSAIELEESLLCEHEDYCQPLVYHDPIYRWVGDETADLDTARREG